ncbi:MAG: MoaD/ThiS family protein [Smithellaceae bacterium]|nr:MoaD/ThiS family protein [Smithellaceae bacterium]
MIVFFQAGGLLKDYLKPDLDEYTRKIEVEPGLTVREIMERINIRPAAVSMVLIAGKRIPWSYVPKEGETIVLLPPVQGG